MSNVRVEQRNLIDYSPEDFEIDLGKAIRDFVLREDRAELPNGAKEEIENSDVKKILTSHSALDEVREGKLVEKGRMTGIIRDITSLIRVSLFAGVASSGFGAVCGSIAYHDFTTPNLLHLETEYFDLFLAIFSAGLECIGITHLVDAVKASSLRSVLKQKVELTDEKIEKFMSDPKKLLQFLQEFNDEYFDGKQTIIGEITNYYLELIKSAESSADSLKDGEAESMKTKFAERLGEWNEVSARLNAMREKFRAECLRVQVIVDNEKMPAEISGMETPTVGQDALARVRDMRIGVSI